MGKISCVKLKRKTSNGTLIRYEGETRKNFELNKFLLKNGEINKFLLNSGENNICTQAPCISSITENVKKIFGIL